MSEEEQKAIESLRIRAEYIGDNFFFSKQGIRDLKKELTIVLSYIDKLEKENKVNLNNYISKDKIRDKIDDLIGEQGTGNLAQYIAIGDKLQVLREILGE